MGTVTAPVEGSGSCPSWMARVSKSIDSHANDAVPTARNGELRGRAAGVDRHDDRCRAGRDVEREPVAALADEDEQTFVVAEGRERVVPLVVRLETELLSECI